MKKRSRITAVVTLAVVTMVSVLLATASVGAGLIAHYTFDVDNAGTTPDATSTNFAALGPAVAIDTTGGVPKVGAGALNMTLANDQDQGGGADGAVTSNSFSWTNDARTVTFWWRVKGPNVDTLDGAFVSFGSTAGNGTRFDIKEQGASNTMLRVEIQGTGQNSNPGIDDGAWHFIAVVVPSSATMADIAWYVDGSATDLNGSSNSLAVATGTGPIAFGDSILGTGAGINQDRTPNGWLDDAQVYDEVLDQTDRAFLFNNPGSVIPEPATMGLLALGGLGVLLRRPSRKA